MENELIRCYNNNFKKKFEDNPNASIKNKSLFVYSKQKSIKSIITKQDSLKDKIKFLKECEVLNYTSSGYNPFIIYDLELDGRKINRKILKSKIELYRAFKLILSRIQRRYYIQYLREEDFFIDEDGILRFKNIEALIPLKEIECECGDDLTFDADSFLESKDKIYEGKYKCIQCSQTYSIFDIEGYKRSVKR